MERLKKELMEKTKKKVSELLSEKDKILCRAVKMLENSEKLNNKYYELIKAWYFLYFPELEWIEIEPEEYLSLLVKYKTRKGFLNDEKLKEYAKNSAGGFFNDEDLNIIVDYAKEIKGLYSQKEKLKEYISKIMEKHYKNVKELCGPILGARLICKAGSLKDLAFLPASTIQVLGAEKALFRHLKRKTKPPKYGLLYQHFIISRLKKKDRGKFARTLAGKIAIAARADLNKKQIYKELIENLEKRLKELGYEISWPSQ